MKKADEPDQMANSTDEAASGRVKQIRQHFLLHADAGLAHRLQAEEFAVHFDRNRTHRHESRLGVRTARVAEEEESRALMAKQLDFYQQQQQIEERDLALARQLQDEMKAKSSATPHNRVNPPSLNNTPANQDPYDVIDHQQLPLSHEDTSNDEQLARILQQEEEDRLTPSSRPPHFKPKII